MLAPMPPRRERQWPWIVTGYAVFFALLVAATSLFYDSVAPEYRPFVVRLAVVIVVGILIVHIWKYFRGDPRWDETSTFEEALQPQPEIPKLDPSFVRLRQELANARQSRSYFDKIFWPRLLALARARGQREAPRVPERNRLGRGPSYNTIESLLDQITHLDADKR
jgi:hypothetical protein